MAHTDDVPGSVRIRTDEGNEWRYDAIQRASGFFDCNRSDAVAFAAESVPELVDAIEDVLERDDLSLEQRREIADQLSTRAVTFSVESTVDVERGR